MKRYYILLSFFLFLTTTSCSKNNTIDHRIADIDKRLDSFLSLELKNDQFPGVQYVVFNKDKILYEFAGGYAKVGAMEKMTSNSLLNVFSTTKVITAIAVLQLAQQEKLKLADKAVKYFPELPYKDVTISQILSQSSGIPNALLGNFYIHWFDEHGKFDRDAGLLSALKKNTTLEFSPGEEVGYSNMGYAILGKIIENVSGLKYEEYVYKNIFSRLNLDKEKINFGSQLQKNAALPYFKRYSPVNNILVLFLQGSTTRIEGSWKSINRPFYFNHPSHGGIMASANEYAKIFMSLMRAENSQLLSAELINKMFSKQIHYNNTTMALSWFMGDMQGKPYFYHQGSGLGYVAEVRIYPQENIGSLLLMNRTEYNALSIINILDAEYISHLNNKQLQH